MIMDQKNNLRRDRPAPESQSDWLQSVLGDRVFASVEELRDFLNQATAAHNNKPRPEFQGLSPELMRQLLSKPFDSPDVAVFHPPPTAAADVPFMRLYRILVEALRDGKGLKATVRGNLPRNFCREAAKTYWGPEKYAKRTRYGEIQTEEHFFSLSVVRHVAEYADMIHLNKGRWLLTKNGLGYLEKSKPSDSYFPLFRAFAEKLNWSVQDGYPRAPHLQASFLFTLGLLAKHGGEWRLDTFYADLFLTAFPMMVYEITKPMIDDDPTRPFRMCYSMRVLERFAAFWGLVETEEVFEDRNDYKIPSGRRVKRLPLLTDLVTFPWLDREKRL